LEVSGDQAPQHYPTDDGNGCECNNYKSADCIASCASNVVNHEVRFEYGKGVITVTCSKGNLLFGCSIMFNDPIRNTAVDKCRSWAAKSIDSCECYGDDNHGATCYAVCGKIV